MPQVGSGASAGSTTFRIVEGTLYRASQHAATQNGASLLIIDEINRGPAVQVFGGSIVAIESDKRLTPAGPAGPGTQYFEITRPPEGDIAEYALPHQLYIVAAMNKADTSVEPLDVAFLRRWAPLELEPDPAVLGTYFGVLVAPPQALPDVPATAGDVYDAMLRAWKAINARIRLGRGAEFQIGHGMLMGRSIAATTLDDALIDAAETWGVIRAHVEEVFFGDLRGVAAVLNVGSYQGHPYELNDPMFADEPRLELKGPRVITQANVYGLLRAVTG